MIYLESTINNLYFLGTMPIIGIDYEKCINCGTCILACGAPEAHYRRDEEQDKIIFEDSEYGCNQCGQCIAQCPEDAILYDMGESFTFEHIENPEKIIPFDLFFKFLSANRSLRRYKKEKVPKEILNKVLLAMSRAPTGANMRSETFTVISDPQKIKELSDAVVEAFKSDPSLGADISEDMEKLGTLYESPVYYDAPHVIIVSSQLSMMMEGNNMGIIITYGRLAAQALGLGTCWNGWTQIALHFNPKIKKIAKTRGKAFAAFTIGYPDTEYHRIPPRPMNKVRFIE